MYKDDDHSEFKEIRSSSSQESVTEREDEMIEDEIGMLFDELTQDGEKK